jgi:hypothetical protein
MALFDRETDPRKERDGVPLDFGEYRVTLRRQGGHNDLYAKELEKLMKPHRPAIKAGVLPKDKDEEIMYRSFARACVVRWETKLSSMRKLAEDEEDVFVDGIDLRGKLVPCSEDALVAVFSAMRSIYNELSECARGDQLFHLGQQESDAGN